VDELEKIPTSVWVVAVALLDSRSCVLMQRRRSATMHGGLWEFPGGKIEPGETPQAAAVREIEEELGLTLSLADLAMVGFASDDMVRGTGPASLTMLLYAARQWSGTPEPRAADALDWFDVATLDALAMPPVDQPLAARLRELLFHKLL
jgi:8-oxo-dGTP diphosphatase